MYTYVPAWVSKRLINNVWRIYFQNQGTLLYSDSPNIEATHVRPPVQYRQDDDDDFDDDEYDHDQNENGPVVSNNVPSWV